MNVQVELEAFDISHYFAGGVYVKQTQIPAYHILVQHRHVYEHLSILASGTATVTRAGVAQTIEGPYVMSIPAGCHHSVAALTNCVWYCIHATAETDPTKLDAVLVMPPDVDEALALAGL